MSEIKSKESMQRNTTNAEPRPLIEVDSDSEAMPNIVDIIVPLTRTVIVDVGGDERAFKFIRYYYGLEGSRTYTLQDIGDAEGITREGVRLVNKKTLQIIRAILLEGESFNDYFAPARIVREAQELFEDLQARDAVLLEQEILSVIELRCGQKIGSQKLPHLKFLLTVFGFKELTPRPSGYSGSEIEGWQVDANLRIDKLRQALISAHKILVSEVRPLFEFELKMFVNRRRKQQIEDEYIFYAAKICPDIEVTSTNQYQIRIERLPSLADQAYRILLENGRPMHAREIVKEINHRLVLAGYTGSAHYRSMTGQMRPPRFEPIGGTGKWKLSEWDHIHAQTIVEIMIEFFHLKKEAAVVDEIYAYVLKKRPDVRKQSIATYLSSKNTFIRVQSSKYALAEWGGKPEPAPPRGESAAGRLASAIKDIFAGSSSQTMPLHQLVRELEKRTNIASSNIYVTLNQLSIIEIELYPGQQRRKLVKYVGNDGQSSLVPLKKTKMQAVQEEITNYLSQQTSSEVAVAKLAEHIPKVTGCSKPTFYSYLSKMESVKKVSIEGKLYCYLDAATESGSNLLSFRQLTQIQDVSLSESVATAIGLLRVETVHAGLFDLGRIFENELKNLLILAREKNVFPVFKKDLDRLVNMIECVVRGGVIESEHHLTLLRLERNLGAHGKILTKEEREALMQNAPYLAGLYINYIVIFHKESLKISGDRVT
jgi:hypothetical protein